MTNIKKAIQEKIESYKTFVITAKIHNRKETKQYICKPQNIFSNDWGIRLNDTDIDIPFKNISQVFALELVTNQLDQG